MVNGFQIVNLVLSNHVICLFVDVSRWSELKHSTLTSFLYRTTQCKDFKFCTNSIEGVSKRIVRKNK